MTLLYIQKDLKADPMVKFVRNVLPGLLFIQNDFEADPMVKFNQSALPTLVSLPRSRF